MKTLELDPEHPEFASKTLEAYYDELDRDPLWFHREICGSKLWGRGDEWGTTGNGQIQVVQAIEDHQRVLVPAGNSTGKTHVLTEIALKFIQKPGRVMMFAGSEEQTDDTIWAKTRALYRRIAPKLPIRGKLHENSLVIDDEWDIQTITTKDETRYQGRHPERLLVLADEGFVLPASFFAALESLLQWPEHKAVISLNPLKPSGATFFKAWKDPESWFRVILDGLEHPNIRHGRAVIPGAISPAFVAKMRKVGERSMEYLARVRGVYPENTGDADRVVPWFFLAAAAKQPPIQIEPSGTPDEELRDLGVDPGRSAERDP